MGTGSQKGRRTKMILFRGRPLYASKDGKLWQIQEWHELTNLHTCVCRRVEGAPPEGLTALQEIPELYLTDTAIIERKDLTAVTASFA